MSDASIEDPDTRRAVRRLRASLWGWRILWIGYVGGVCPQPVLGHADHPTASRLLAVAFLAVPAIVAAWPLERRRIGIDVMRRILGTYRWQRLPVARRTAPTGHVSYDVPDPERPDRTVAVVVRGPLARRRWARLAADGAVDRALLAGDPRFAAVLALPGPRALALVRPRHGFQLADGVQPKTVGEAAWRKARAARISG